MMVSVDATRCTPEEMWDAMRAEEGGEERGMTREDEPTAQEDPPAALPLQPTSRARVPSSVRAKKALYTSLENLALPPSKGAAAMLKENIALESPIANLMLLADPAAPKCVFRPLDLAPDTGHSPLAEREVVANNGSVTCVHFFPSSVTPAVPSPAKSREPEPGSINAQLRRSETRSFDDRMNAPEEQPSFSFLTAQEPPHPLTPAPHMLPNSTALPATTPSSGKKWKDDGTLRLKKVHLPAYTSLSMRATSPGDEETNSVLPFETKMNEIT